MSVVVVMQTPKNLKENNKKILWKTPWKWMLIEAIEAIRILILVKVRFGLNAFNLFHYIKKVQA